MSDTIREGKVVFLDYVLTETDKGTLIEQVTDGAFAYLHGTDNVISGLEEALEGLEVGATFDVVVPPDKAYGPRNGLGVQVVPRREFPRDIDLRPGEPVHVEGPHGEDIALWVLELRGSRVVIDTNHPLAGLTLRFQGTVRGIRDATLEEHAHGHAHGPGGHSH